MSDEEFNTTNICPDFYTLSTNQKDWAARYLHPEYAYYLQDHLELSDFEQPCPDVFWFPIVSDRLCDDLIAIAEGFGQWFDGSYYDNRTETGYSAVPTTDVYLSQVGLDPVWLKFLRLYVAPLQDQVYWGYGFEPPRAHRNFIVRYKPDEQASLRAHHDTSTYTINIALNSAGVDYEGGGCRFIRYDCAVTATKKGWMLMHPGRLTHMHEGLPTTNGTRYIMISFIDP